MTLAPPDRSTPATDRSSPRRSSGGPRVPIAHRASRWCADEIASPLRNTRAATTLALVRATSLPCRSRYWTAVNRDQLRVGATLPAPRQPPPILPVAAPAPRPHSRGHRRREARVRLRAAGETSASRGLYLATCALAAARTRRRPLSVAPSRPSAVMPSPDNPPPSPPGGSHARAPMFRSGRCHTDDVCVEISEVGERFDCTGDRAD